MDNEFKPVEVPQYVADWYEEHKYTFEYSVYKLCADFREGKLEGDLHRWFINNFTNPVETLVRMKLFTYKVNKGKHYMAMLTLTGEYLRCTSDGELGHYKVDKDYISSGAKAYWFTEDTLQKYKVWKNDSYFIEEIKE